MDYYLHWSIIDELGLDLFNVIGDLIYVYVGWTISMLCCVIKTMGESDVDHRAVIPYTDAS